MAWLLRTMGLADCVVAIGVRKVKRRIRTNVPEQVSFFVILFVRKKTYFIDEERINKLI